MDRFGLTINTMSLGGLAIAIGELVDDAIIDVENVVRRLRENAARPEAERLPVLEVVYHASTEIRHSVVFATVIVALVFLPLFMLGQRRRAAAAAARLRATSWRSTASLVVALTVTPVLCSWLLPNSRLIASGAEPRLTRRLKAAYERWLGHAFRYWRTVLGDGGGVARGGAGRHPRRRPLVPAGVQRRRADRQRGDRFQARASRTPMRWAMRSSGCCSACPR